MPSGDGLRRLRWRLRGAWQWPAFVLLTLADGLILHALPPVAPGVRVIPGILLGAVGNLFLVAVAAPWLARRLQERQERARTAGLEPGPPYEVVLSRAATGLLVAGALGLVAAGLAARPLIVSETEDTEANARAVRAHVLARAPAEARRNVDSANTIRVAPDLFRTCVALDDRSRAYCVWVDTATDPPVVRRDPNQQTNADFQGGDGGR
jgi:hypothetical protein